MTQTLKADPDFVPCPVQPGDELFANGIFVFNITSILAYIERHPEEVELREVNVSDFPPEFSAINEAHLDNVDVSRPVLLAEIAPGRGNLIDGNHRMAKARRSGIDKLPARCLTVRQHLRFLTTRQAYMAYVEYWNGKVKSLGQQQAWQQRQRG